MVSIRRYLGRGDESGSLRVSIFALLQQIASTAVVTDKSVHAALVADFERLCECIRELPERIPLTVGSALQLLEDYNRGISAYIRKQAHEMHDIVSMMTDAVAGIAGENTRSAAAMRDIANRLEHACTIQDIDTLKSHLGDSLQAFREETLRQKEQAENLIVTLRQEIGGSSRQAGVPSQSAAQLQIDPATTLPLKEACLEAMYRPIAPGKRRFVVTVIVTRLAAINARFGEEIGDEVLCRFGEFIEQQIEPNDRLYRWDGPALVALLERTEGLEQIRLQFRRMLEHRLEETFEVSGRSLLIPVSAAWSVFQLVTTAVNAEKQIQAFTASQGSRDYI